MPSLESELIDFAGNKYFASLDFSSAYWQILLDEASYDACGIFVLQGAFKAARVWRRLKKCRSVLPSACIAMLSGYAGRIQVID